MAEWRGIVTAALGAAVLAAAAPASGQRWGREGTPRDGACFYEHAEYEGDYFCVRAGDDVSSMPPGMNDRISSIRIFGRAQVVVYKDYHFGGSSTRFEYDIANLGDAGWNDRISSIRIHGSSHGHHGGSGDHSYGGYPDPDRIVRRAYQDILDREPDSAGLRLYRSRMIDDGWTEQQVREALRTSPEYREKNAWSRQKAEEIVRRAYHAVLDREPDAGARGYVDRVFRERMSQEEVERELRKSPEYRNRNR
jgi:hypothetical protein